MIEAKLLDSVADLYDVWQHDVDERAGIVWVGFSGGLDSTALLLSLLTLRSARGLDVRCIHVNHGIHSQSNAWAAHCESFCKTRHVALEQCRVTLPDTGNLEANARQARYDCFADWVGSGDSLWLAHHRNDQFETGLLRMLQGRGLLQVRRYQQIGALTVLRPLLSYDKADLERYVMAADGQWVEDVSNSDLTFDRNYIRHEVAPAVLARWPNAPERLAGSIARADASRRALHATLARLEEVSVDQIPGEVTVAVAWLQVFLESRGCFHATSKALTEFKYQLDQGRRARLEFGDGSGLEVKNKFLRYLHPD